MRKVEEFIYEFNGFWNSPSRCHIRIIEKPDKPLVIMCSQMSQKPGTSVTNMSGEIAEEILNYLGKDNISLMLAIQKYMKNKTLSEKIGDLIEKLKSSNKMSIFALESMKLALEYHENYKEKQKMLNEFIWVEHYGANVGLSDSGSYAIVSFEKDSWKPNWYHLSKAELVEKTGFSEDDFNTPQDVYLA